MRDHLSGPFAIVAWGGGTPGFAVVQPSPFLTLLEAVALPLDCCAVPALCPPVRDNCTE